MTETAWSVSGGQGMRGKNTETAAGPLPPAVLVVDDDMGVRLVQRRVLEDAGYQVIEAVNGEEGIKVSAPAQL